MNIFTGSIEIQMLCWSVVLGLVQLMIATSLALKDQGVAYNIGPRESAVPPVTKLTGRFQRAFGNFRETFVYFAVAVLVVTALGKNSAHSALGAQIYFWSRLAYVPVFALGIAGLRTAVWTVSIVGLVMVLLAAAG
ncbi:MAG TPA: MAPEG family protein [Rhizomicrobium sp.]|nr:MAPEG family protein [Rhizomicrobium sp.]